MDWFQQITTRPSRLTNEGVHTFMDAQDDTFYDKHNAYYDLVIGSRAYNRLVWGNSPTDYANFARQALATDGTTPYLDAGCGSCVFTAEVYRNTARRLVLLDRSLGMLLAAKKRLAGANGHLPENIVLVQGDLFDLPFAAGAFGGVGWMGMVHIFEDSAEIATNLAALLTSNGQLHMTSLIASSKGRRRYLNLMHRAGEVATPQTANEVSAELSPVFTSLTMKTQGGMAYLVGTKQ